MPERGTGAALGIFFCSLGRRASSKSDGITAQAVGGGGHSRRTNGSNSGFSSRPISLFYYDVHVFHSLHAQMVYL